ncbi:MAG TPA: DUF2461 domain-containing protein [Candidatus Dormibacteraeota bacterium]|nr:DUF2461 domain-containing protein [Candidatus Dormibacteraeota bacterium]
MATFKGWSEDCQRFFIGLELDNSKKYFEANRRTYEDLVKGPMVALLESLEPEFGPGKVFRANRDIRFSKDKSPYKTNIAADVGMGGKGGYLSLDARGFTVATGRYMMSPEEIARFRKRVAADASGDQLAAIAAKLRKSGYELGGEELKRVPPPWPQEHPRADLLRRKSLYVWKNYGLQPWLGSGSARRYVVKMWTDAQPLNDWFKKYL